jgi:hypothetical protein
MKEIDEDTKRWKTSPFPGLGELTLQSSYTMESNLHIQCNLNQNSNVILHRNRKINPKIHMEAQKSLIS